MSPPLPRLAPDEIRAVPEIFQGIYSHGVVVPGGAKMVLMSGQIGLAPDGSLEDGFDAQCIRAMSNVEALLRESGLGLQDMLRVVYYVTDPANLAPLTALRKSRWHLAQPPAVTTLVVAALAGPSLLVEIEVTAGRAD